MQQHISISPQSGTTAPFATMCQLFLSHLFAGGAALGTFYWLSHMGLPFPQPLSIALTVAGLLGLLLSLNILYNLQLLELILTRFTQARPVEASNTFNNTFSNTFRRWPFTSLFKQVYQLNVRIQNYEQQAQMTTEFREQTLRQASEAAALEERNRIARDLHDSIKQQIFSISVSAAAAKAHMSSGGEDARMAVEDIQLSVKEAQVEMRALLQQLRSSPLENTNLRDALETQAQALGYRTGAHTQVEIAELPTADQLPPGAHEAIFRLVQEAFANIARHARAETIWLKLYQQEQQLHIEIRDDGQGFDLQTVQKGMGLNNLQERAQAMHGTLNIQSTVGKGTTIHAIIPLLDALPTKEEQERQQLEIRRMIEQANGHDVLSRTAMWATIALLLIKVPDFAILLGIGVVLYGYGVFFYAKARVKLLTGNESIASRSLQRREHRVRPQLFLFLLFWAYYLYIRLTLWQQPLFTWLLLAATLLVAGLSLINLKQRYHAIQRYYDALHQPRLNWELDQDRRISTRLIRIWLIAIAFNFILSRPHLGPSLNPMGWIISTSVITLILVWGIIPCIDYWQIYRTKQHITQTKTQEEGNNNGSKNSRYAGR
jgi:signal transduction histidine kinase